MTRETEQSLIDFCAEQRKQFTPASWLKVPHPNRDEFIATVLFLAGVDWYGHNSALTEVASELEPESIGNLSQVVRRTG